MNFFSTELGRSFSDDEILGSTDLLFLEQITDEVVEKLTTVKDELSMRKMRARAYNEYLAPDDFQRMSTQQTELGRLHQRLLRHRKRLKQSNPQSKVPPIEMFFYQAARNMLDQPEFQRLVLTAEQRRAAALSTELRKQRA